MGRVERAKAIVKTVDGWYRFDLASGLVDERPWSPAPSGRLVVIGTDMSNETLDTAVQFLRREAGMSVEKYGIALDLGTSGVRGQAIDLRTGEIQSTAITTQHPLPGGNVMDHLHFAVETSVERQVHDHPRLDARHGEQGHRPPCGVPRERVERVAICGNPIQLSLVPGHGDPRPRLRGGEQAGVAWESRSNRARRASSPSATSTGSTCPASAELVVPPAVRHEVGADALAMMLKSGMLDRDEIALVTDYGTNAEMALKVGDRVVTGSAACGPAFEGQAIKYGMLAAPGAISDLDRVDGSYRNRILDDTCIADGRRPGRPSHRRGDRGGRRAGARHHGHGRHGGYRPGARGRAAEVAQDRLARWSDASGRQDRPLPSTTWARWARPSARRARVTSRSRRSWASTWKRSRSPTWPGPPAPTSTP